MKNKNLRIFTILLVIGICIVLVTLLKGTKSVSVAISSRETAQQALVDEAYAFYYRGLNINYDQNSVTYFSNIIPSNVDATNPDYNKNISNALWKMRTSFFRPEEATPQNIQYTDCSDYITNIYRNAFVTQNDKNFILLFGDTSYSSIFNGDMVWGTYRLMSIANSSSNPLHYITQNYYNIEYYLAWLRNNTCSGDECYTQLETYLQNNLKAELLAQELQPGDIIVARYRTKCDSIINCANVTTGGHAMLYVGKPSPNGTTPQANKDRYILHSMGSSYVYDSKYDSSIDETDGTIQQITLDEALDYVLRSGINTSKIITEIAILRPLDVVLNGNDYLISDSTNARRSMPYLVRTKIASVNEHDSVNLGDKITYTITLENRASTAKYTNISITDKVPTNTTYVSCTGNCTRDNSNIAWESISINPGETKTFSYTVKVKSTTSLGSEIISDKTVVAGITMNTIKTTVNKTLTAGMQEALVDRVKTKLKDKEYTSNSSFEFIKDAYADISSIDFGNSTAYVQTLFSKFFNITSSDVYVLKNSFTEDKFTKMYVNGLFGGYYTTNENQYSLSINNEVLNGEYPVLYDGREFTYDNNTLMIGDVVLVYDTNYANENYAYRKYNAYLYLGYNSSKQVVEFATIDENKKVIVMSSKLGSTNRSRLLESLMGQNAFIVLRPSYAINGGVIALKGDVNLDGIVDIKDAKILAKYIIDKTSSYSNEQLLVGDMNGDGAIKINDVVKLLKSL